MEEGRHRFIVGKTRSGKSYYTYAEASRWREEHPNGSVVVLNHKRDHGWNQMIKPFEKLGSMPNYFQGCAVNWVLTEDDEWFLIQFLNKIHRAHRKDDPGECLIIFDESQAIPQNFKPLKTLLVQGAGMGISVWMLTQRPAFVSLFGITQSSDIIIFNVMGETDKARLNEFMENSFSPYIRGERILEKYHFLAYNYAENDLQVMPPISHTGSKIESVKRYGLFKWVGGLAFFSFVLKTIF